jgi:hypothetical protein
VRSPPHAEIYAPEFPPEMEWLNVPFLRMNTLMGRGGVLVEFWDFARVNSLRTMPYLKAWHERYAGAGLNVIGIHSPGYSFGRKREPVARAVARLEVPYAVLLDPRLEVWRLYGNKGWPGRYLFDRTGRLAFLHYGEGAYLETELAIQECVGELREPLAPLRPEDEPGARLEPQTADIALPADRDRLELVRDWEDGEDWIEASDAGAAASFGFRAGAAYAVLSGGGVEPGLYEVEGTVEAEFPGLRLHGVQFTPLPPNLSGVDWPGTIDAVAEVDIETSRGSGAPVHRTTIWAVVEDGDVYVRALRGRSGRWYRELIANPDATLHLDGQSVPVRATVADDPESIERASAGLRRKYGASSALDSMLRDEILDSTLRLERR